MRGKEVPCAMGLEKRKMARVIDDCDESLPRSLFRLRIDIPNKEFGRRRTQIETEDGIASLSVPAKDVAKRAAVRAAPSDCIEIDLTP